MLMTGVKILTVGNQWKSILNVMTHGVVYSGMVFRWYKFRIFRLTNVTLASCIVMMIIMNL